MSGDRVRWVGWIGRLSLRQLSLAAAGVVVLASGAFGGLEPAQDPAPAALEAGVARTADPFEVTVDRVRVVEGSLGEGVPEPRGRYLAVVASIRSTADRSVTRSIAQQAVGLADVPGLYGPEGTEVPSLAAEPAVHVLADASLVGTMVPGLTYEVVYLFDQAVDAPVPTSVDVVTRRHVYRASSLDGQMLWTDEVVDARGALEVRVAQDES